MVAGERFEGCGLHFRGSWGHFGGLGAVLEGLGARIEGSVALLDANMAEKSNKNAKKSRWPGIREFRRSFLEPRAPPWGDLSFSNTVNLPAGSQPGGAAL